MKLPSLNSRDGNILVLVGLVLTCLTIILVTWHVRNQKGQDFFGHPRPHPPTASAVMSSAFEEPRKAPGALDSE